MSGSEHPGTEDNPPKSIEGATEESTLANWEQNVLDPVRIAVLEALDVLDTAPEVSFDRLIQIAVDAAGASTALLSLVDGYRQFFKAKVSSHTKISCSIETPLSSSFCKYVVGSRRPLIVEDAREHPVLRDNPAVVELDVIAYLGYPVVLESGHVMGSLCVIDDKPHAWTDADRRIVENLADLAAEELDERLFRVDALEVRAAHREELDDNFARLRSMEALGGVAADVAHELKSHLSVIRSTGEIMSREMDEDVHWQDDLATLLEAVERALSVTRQLAQANRPEDTNESTLDLCKLMKRSEAVFRRLLTPDIRFEMSTCDTEVCVRGRRQRLARAVMNLILNAREALDGEPGTIRVEVRPGRYPEDAAENEENSWATISVSAAGGGSGEDMVDNAFTPEGPEGNTFDTADRGLTTVHRIVKAHRGSVVVESTPGELGTVFIQLPRTP